MSMHSLDRPFRPSSLRSPSAGSPRRSPRRSIRRSAGRPPAAWLGLLVAVVLAGCAAPDRGPASGPIAAAPATASASAVPSFAELLLEAADHEGLYTLAGGLKPLSTGIWSHRFDVSAPDLASVRAVRAQLAPLRDDRWYADVQVFATAHDGQRTAEAYVVHRAALARTLERHARFWAPYGITPCTHPAEVVAVVDRMPRGDRWRAYGQLFGYPDAAVEFFVAAGLAADAAAEGGEPDVGPGRDREFVHVPTWAEPEGRFTYAVPLDHEANAADAALAAAAARIRSAYDARRPDVVAGRRGLAVLRRLDDRMRPLVPAVIAEFERAAGATDGGPGRGAATVTAAP